MAADVPQCSRVGRLTGADSPPVVREEEAMTTSREVQSAVFEGTQFGAGYDERAVDALRHDEERNGAELLLTAAHLRALHLPETTLRRGTPWPRSTPSSRR